MTNIINGFFEFILEYPVARTALGALLGACLFYFVPLLWKTGAGSALGSPSAPMTTGIILGPNSKNVKTKGNEIIGVETGIADDGANNSHVGNKIRGK